MTTDAATLRAAVLPRSSVVTDTALVVGGAGFIALCAQVVVHVPRLTPIPFTLQTFAVLAVGAALGSWRGGIATLLYLLVGIAGLPVYAEGASGASVVFGYSGGYLVGMVLAAVLVGSLAERRGMDRRVHTAVLAMLAGALVILSVGTVWFAAVMDMSLGAAITKAVVPFLAVEAIKIAVATAALPTAWKLLSLLRK